mmetsp:Transcript_5589/g.15896  ORF Transcript_5589/g.15896 Transcript_5589/m.15896 type:complete len:250 (-) Transcript_5589:293-1042(-)
MPSDELCSEARGVLLHQNRGGDVGEHWWALRKVGERWYDFDSLLDAPVVVATNASEFRKVLEAHLKWKSEFGERRTVHIVHGLSELPVTPGAMPHDNVGSRVAPTLRDGIGPESSLGMTREAPSTYGANNQISGAVESSCVEATGIQLEPGGASDKLAVAGSAMQISSAPASGERTDFAVVPGATQTTLDPPCLDDATYNVQVCASAVAPSRFRADGAYGTGAARKAARLPFKSPRQVQPREGSGVVSA